MSVKKTSFMSDDCKAVMTAYLGNNFDPEIAFEEIDRNKVIIEHVLTLKNGNIGPFEPSITNN